MITRYKQKDKQSIYTRAKIIIRKSKIKEITKSKEKKA